MFRSISDAFASLSLANSHRRPPGIRARRLAHEWLEARVVLSGNGVGNEIALASGQGDSETVLVSSTVPAAATAEGAESGECFASAEELALPGVMVGQEHLSPGECFASAEELKQYLIEDALVRWDSLFGKQASDFYPCVIETLQEYSRTGIQVAGVDEANRVVSGDGYVYSTTGADLTVRQIGDDGEPVVVARLAVTGNLFLSGDRLTVIGSRRQMDDQVNVMVFDVSDPSQPTLLEETLLDGTCIDARAVGDRVYVITQSDFFLPEPLVVGEVDLANYQPRYYETKDVYLARIEDQVLNLVLPGFTTFDGEGQTVDSGWLVEPAEVLKPLSNAETQLSRVVVFDVGDDQPGTLDAMVVAAEDDVEIQFTEDNMFVLGSQVQCWGASCDGADSVPAGGNNETAVLQFSLDESGAFQLDAAGTVPGNLLGDCSFGMQDGYLHVVTTTGSDSDTSTGVYVLQQNDTELSLVGQLEGIATGEYVYTARTAGSQVYLATVGGSDPLVMFESTGMTRLTYSVDLSDPTSPALAGGLNVAGFCNYLQTVDDGLVLVLGRETAEKYPELSLFDVSDPDNPQLVDSYILDAGERGGFGGFDYSSNVAYFPDQGILTVIAAAPGGETNRSTWVFRIDPTASGGEGDSAIAYVATVDQTYAARRTFLVDDKLVVCSTFEVGVYDLADPNVALGTQKIVTNSVNVVEALERTEHLIDGEIWVDLEASTTGCLTFDALFDRTDESDATLTLYDWQLNELAVSESDYPWSQARLNWQAEAGQRFFLKISGTVSEVDLRILNILSIEGENTDSVLRINAGALDGDVDFKIYWHSDSGVPWKDNETVLTVVTRRLSLDLGGVHYDFAMSTPNVVIEGSGQNALTVDVTRVGDNTCEHDPIVADLGDGSGTISCSGPIFGMTGEGEEFGFEMTATDFQNITVNGGDVAKLRGSEGNDVLTIQPGTATMETPSGSVRVNDFAEVHGYSSPGDYDVAKIYDTSGDDRYVATPDYARMTGEDYCARAKGFRYTHGYSTAGGEDTAKLKDFDGDVVCVARAEYVRTKGAGYNNRAKFFEQVKVRGGGGTEDSVKLRDAVLTSVDATIAQNNLQAAVLLSGFEHLELRGHSSDQRPDTETIDLLLAYWPATCM